MNHYPLVFIHGFAGWGEEDGLSHIISYWGHGENNILKHLEDKGFECHAPSVGPYSGTWDRCCELWAYLFGGRVDYGKVHSEKYGHKRYGKTYDHGAIEDLGKTEEHAKIHLIGHSFGGPTAKAFVDLLTRGSKEEQEGTDPEDLSPLFKGNHGNLIASCSTLSGVNNGTSYDYLPVSLINLASAALLVYGATCGNVVNQLLDFGLQHYGIGTYPKKYLPGLPTLLRSLKGIRQFISNNWGNPVYEMSVPYAKEINSYQETNPDVYYFAYRADCTKAPVGPFVRPDAEAASKVGFSNGLLFGLTNASHYWKDKKDHHVDKERYLHDGYINVVSQSAPLECVAENGGFDIPVDSGVWYNMPIIRGDHLWWNGMDVPKEQRFEYYDKMVALLTSL